MARSPNPVEVAIDLPMSASFEFPSGGGTPIKHLRSFSIMVAWTDGPGSPIGTLYMQVTHDGAVWQVLGDAVAVNGPGSHIFEVADANYTGVRLKYVRTSGGSTATAQATLYGVEK
jgi:hypothetical protein